MWVLSYFHVPVRVEGAAVVVAGDRRHEDGVRSGEVELPDASAVAPPRDALYVVDERVLKVAAPRGAAGGLPRELLHPHALGLPGPVHLDQVCRRDAEPEGAALQVDEEELPVVHAVGDGHPGAADGDVLCAVAGRDGDGVARAVDQRDGDVALAEERERREEPVRVDLVRGQEALHRVGGDDVRDGDGARVVELARALDDRVQVVDELHGAVIALGFLYLRHFP